MKRNPQREQATEDSPLPVNTKATPSIPVQILQCVLLTIGASVFYLLVSHFVIQSVEVVGASMAPTMKEADRFLLNRWVYYLQQPKRTDVVVVKDPTDGAFVVKRIIAMPGEAVLFKDGQVYVNGVRLSEPYVAPGKRTFTYSTPEEQLIVCGRDQYFVLGDNRENSFDSRMYGPVRRKNILGLVNL